MKALFIVSIVLAVFAGCSEGSTPPSEPQGSAQQEGGQEGGNATPEGQQDESPVQPSEGADQNDTSNIPSKPLTLVREFPEDIQFAVSVAVDSTGQRVFVSSGNGLSVVDLSKGRVTKSNSVGFLGVNHLVLSGSKLYASGIMNGFSIINPDTLEAESIDLNGDPNKSDNAGSFRIVGNKAYVLAGKLSLLPVLEDLPGAPDLLGTNTIYVVDLDTKQVSSFPHYTSPNDLEIINGIAYVTQANGIHHDTAGVHDGNDVGDATKCSTPRSVATDGGDRLFVACDGNVNGLLIYEGITRRQPKIVKTIRPIVGAQAVAFANGKVYVAAAVASFFDEVANQIGESFGLYVIDPTKPESSAIVDKFPGVGQVARMQVIGTKVYLATQNGSCDLAILDLSTRQYSRVCGVSNATTAVADGRKLYVGTDTNAFGIKIFDRTTGEMQVALASPEHVKRLGFVGDKLYYSTMGSVHRLDVSVSPPYDSSLTTSDGPFAIEGNVIYSGETNYAYGYQFFVQDLSKTTIDGMRTVKDIKSDVLDIVLGDDSVFVLAREALYKVKKSDLSVTTLLTGTNLYSESKWRLHRQGNDLYVVWQGGLQKVDMTTGAATPIDAEIESRYVFFHDSSLFWGAVDPLYLRDLVAGTTTRLTVGTTENECYSSVIQGLFMGGNCGYGVVGYDASKKELFMSNYRAFRSYTLP